MFTNSYHEKMILFLFLEQFIAIWKIFVGLIFFAFAFTKNNCNHFVVYIQLKMYIHIHKMHITYINLRSMLGWRSQHYYRHNTRGLRHFNCIHLIASFSYLKHKTQSEGGLHAWWSFRKRGYLFFVLCYQQNRWEVKNCHQREPYINLITPVLISWHNCVWPVV